MLGLQAAQAQQVEPTEQRRKLLRAVGCATNRRHRAGSSLL